jgi:hypothetical protein
LACQSKLKDAIIAEEVASVVLPSTPRLIGMDGGNGLQCFGTIYGESCEKRRRRGGRGDQVCCVCEIESTVRSWRGWCLWERDRARTREARREHRTERVGRVVLVMDLQRKQSSTSQDRRCCASFGSQSSQHHCTPMPKR